MDNCTGVTTPRGELTLDHVRNLGDLKQAPRGWRLKNWLKYRRRELPATAMQLMGRLSGTISIQSKLEGALYRPNFSIAPERLARVRALLSENFDPRKLLGEFGGELTEYGVLSRRMVTTAGVGFIVDAFQDSVELEIMKFHGFGTGSTAENVADTDIETEMTTQYASDNTRPTGSLTEGASANIFRTVGTFSPDTGGTIAITEHGILSLAAVASGVLLDRSVFSAVNVVAASDSLQATYEITFTAGS